MGVPKSRVPRSPGRPPKDGVAPIRCRKAEVYDRIEQDHRRVKRRTGPMLGFQSFWTARRTLAGVEAMAMLTKGQVRAVPANDISAQRAFVHQVFGAAA
jgi:transposase-like protein